VGDGGGGPSDEDGEEENIGEVDDGKGEEGAVFLEVGLVSGDHPDGPVEVEGPSGTEENSHDGVEVGDGVNDIDAHHEDQGNERPEGDEVG